MDRSVRSPQCRTPAPGTPGARALLRYWRYALYWSGLPETGRVAREATGREGGPDGLVLVDTEHIDRGILPEEAAPTTPSPFGIDAVVLACERRGRKDELVWIVAGIPVHIEPDGVLHGVSGALPVLPWSRFSSEEHLPAHPVAPIDNALRWIDEYRPPGGEAWREHWQAFREFLRRFRRRGLVFGVSYGSGAANQAIARKYEGLLEGEPARGLVRLVERLAGRGGRRADMARGSTDLHLGHMQTEYALDPEQRHALAQVLWAARRARGHVVAVQGPPGTGKTSFLQGAVASLAVQRVAQGGDPPIIVATGFTNQAVNNVIEGFSDAVEPRSPGGQADPAVWFRCRWIVRCGSDGDALRGYGWFAPARSREGRVEYAHTPQILQGGRGPGGAADWLMGADPTALEAGYIEAAARAYPDRAFRSVCEVMGVLRRDLQELTRRIRDFSLRGRRVIRPVGWVPASRAGELRGRADRARELHDKALRLDGEANALERLVSTHERMREQCPWWRWGARRRTTRVRRALARMLGLPASASAGWVITEAARRIDALRAGARVARQEAAKVVAEAGCADFEELCQRARESEAVRAFAVEFAEAARNALSEQDAPSFEAGWAAGRYGRPAPEGGWEPAMRVAGALWHGCEDADACLRDLEELLDRTLRRRAFDLAMRYWEGWWICQGDDRRFSPSGLVALGPVIVSTAASLPNLLGGLDRPPDLVVVDEAGQMAPEIGGWLFTVGNALVVVGDEWQLRPFARPPARVDRWLRRRAGLPDDPEGVDRTPWGVSGGNFMRLVSAASDFEPVMLLRHYRCLPPIMGFFNELCYGGRLLAMRTGAPPGELPALGWIEVFGKAERPEGGLSWVNQAEVEALVRWLRRLEPRLRAHYRTESGEPPALSEIVAVITPYDAQSKQIRDRLKQEGNGWQEIRVGTVHRFQGAEAPVVFFSAVADPDLGTGFLDREPNLLNVAVSRARDAFVLLGHPQALGLLDDRETDPGCEAPTRVLARHLRRVGHRLNRRVLVVVESPIKKKALTEWLGSEGVRVVSTGGAFVEVREVDPVTCAIRWRYRDPGSPELASLRQALTEPTWSPEELVVATDDDREGDAIGWHVVRLARELGWAGDVTRMVFHAVRPAVVCEAFDRRRPWTDLGRARAGLVRGAVDWLVMRYFARSGIPGRNGSRWGRVRAANVAELAEATGGYRVRARLRAAGAEVVADLCHGGEPVRFARRDEAETAAARIVTGAALRVHLRRLVRLIGGPPPVSTGFVLARAWEQRRLWPEETMKILEALYLGKRKGENG